MTWTARMARMARTAARARAGYAPSSSVLRR